MPFDRALAGRIAEELSCSRVLGGLLVARGIDGPEAADRFLNATLHDLADPSLMPGIDAAVERIVRAIRERQRVVVFGDYDVDGLASTALFLEFFEFVGCPAECCIPRRLEEGYGLNLEAVRRLAAAGAQLIVTVDNGSSAVEEVALARSLGVDVVITDHHLLSDPAPEPLAFVNPWIPGSRYPFSELAGVGVAFKVIWAICRRLSASTKVSERFKGFMLESLALVALGTISDVVPLVGENRILARYGLRALEESTRPGLCALVDLALRDERGQRDLEARDVAFRIGPCINSAGRLGEADVALRALITRDPVEASQLVRRLARDNDRRRNIEREIYEEARELLLSSVDLDSDRAVVLAGEGWHPGVIGIVASRLVDEFFRPTLLISLEDGVGKGSARSIPQVQIRDVLERASDCLDNFGGHARAAGVRLEASSVDALREKMNRAIDVPPEAMVPELEIDGEYPLRDWTPDVLRDVARLAPFGEGNREPIFATRGIDVVGSPRLIGRDGAHLSFFVRQDERALRAVAFGLGDYHREITRSNARVSMAYRPVLGRWRNEERVELFARELRVEV